MLKATVAVVCAAAALWAADEAVAPLGKYTAFERRYWAFQPRADAKPPAISDAWIRTPIDAFILAGLRAKGLTPAPEADRATLIRRVTYDLHRTAADSRRDRRLRHGPLAERVGEGGGPAAGLAALRRAVGAALARRGALRRVGRLRVRHAPSGRVPLSRLRGARASTTDKPYDAFVREQLAGDEMDPSNQTYLVASGFNRLGPLRKNAGNQDVASSQNEVLTEMTNIVGAAFLGVTVGCARCHDHKFDPFRQSDYYRMQAHFAQTQPNDIVHGERGGAGRVEGEGRPDPAGDAAAASGNCGARRMARRRRSRCSSRSWTRSCPRRSPRSTA